MSRDWQPWHWNGQWVELPTKPEEVEVVKVKKLPPRPEISKVYQLAKTFFMWEPAWLRLKLDAIVHLNPYEAVVIDYKTGKKFGNEIKHGEQTQLYQLVSFIRFPELEQVTTELWYLDQDEVTVNEFTRSQGMRFQRAWDKRGNKLTTAVEFPPNPNQHSCKYCEYGPWGTGHCSVGRR